MNYNPGFIILGIDRASRWPKKDTTPWEDKLEDNDYSRNMVDFFLKTRNTRWFKACCVASHDTLWGASVNQHLGPVTKRQLKKLSLALDKILIKERLEVVASCQAHNKARTFGLQGTLGIPGLFGIPASFDLHPSLNTTSLPVRISFGNHLQLVIQGHSVQMDVRHSECPASPRSA